MIPLPPEGLPPDVINSVDDTSASMEKGDVYESAENSEDITDEGHPGSHASTVVTGEVEPLDEYVEEDSKSKDSRPDELEQSADSSDDKNQDSNDNDTEDIDDSDADMEEEEEEEEEEEDSVPVLVTMTPDEYRNKMLSEHENEVNKQPKAKNGHGKASAPGTTDAGGASSESDIDPHRMRFNYASLDAGAVVMASNPESERTWTLLNEDMDKYSISPCEVRKWVGIGLSEDVQIDSVVIANYERYSSTVKTFQLLGSHSYPVKEWMLLGEFEAKAVNGEQLFRLPKKAYARYLKFRFVKHHGSEFFCTLSLIRVYGSSMLESLREDLVESVQEVQKVQQKLDGKADLPSSDVEPEAELESEPKVEARDEVGNEEQAAAYPDPELDSERCKALSTNKFKR